MYVIRVPSLLVSISASKFDSISHTWEAWKIMWTLSVHIFIIEKYFFYLLECNNVFTVPKKFYILNYEKNTKYNEI